MQMGISPIDLAILLPAFVAAWNLVGGQTLFASPKDTGRAFLSPDGSFAIEAPAGDPDFQAQEPESRFSHSRDAYSSRFSHSLMRSILESERRRAGESKLLYLHEQGSIGRKAQCK
jgi:hypothetical protein